MKVLFTGHRGFLGREIIPEINKSVEICCYQGDLRDYSQLSQFVADQKVERVIHAAVRGGRRNRIDTYLDLAENLVSSMNVLRIQLPTISFCSGKIYGWQNSIENKSENDFEGIFPDGNKNTHSPVVLLVSTTSYAVLNCPRPIGLLIVMYFGASVTLTPPPPLPHPNKFIILYIKRKILLYVRIHHHL